MIEGAKKYQSGEDFEAAFYFKWTNTTSRKYKLLLRFLD